MLLAEVIGSDAFALLDHLGRGVGGKNTNKKVDVVGLDGKFEDCPAVFEAFLFNQGFTVFGDLTNQNRLAPFGCPDEVVVEEVDAVFIALVVAEGECVGIHIVNIQTYQLFGNTLLSLPWLKPCEKPT